MSTVLTSSDQPRTFEIKPTSDPIDRFKDLHTEAIEVFLEQIRLQEKDSTNDGHDILTKACSVAINYALSGALGEITDNLVGFIRSVEETSSDTGPALNIRVRDDLIDSYFLSANI